jgi:hypothetical protein
MDQISFWQIKSHSASQEIRRFLWNLKVRFHVYKRPPPIPILSHTNPVQTLTPYLFKIHSNITLPSVPRSTKLSFPFMFPD